MYYHLSEQKLAVGTLLQSRFPTDEFRYQYTAMHSALAKGAEEVGQFLRIHPLYWLPLKETIFERLRASEFRHRPSRLFASVFLCRTRTEIERYASSYETKPFLYVCQVDVAEDLFEGDVLLASTQGLPPVVADAVEELEGRARRYWQGDRTSNPILEVLAPSGEVRVVAEEPF